jgi:hypothetical protein
MTKLENALEYFKKKNYSPSGTLSKIFAYEIAEKSIRDIDSIIYYINQNTQDMISDSETVNQIKKVLSRKLS